MKKFFVVCVLLFLFTQCFARSPRGNHGVSFVAQKMAADERFEQESIQLMKDLLIYSFSLTASIAFAFSVKALDDRRLGLSRRIK